MGPKESYNTTAMNTFRTQGKLALLLLCLGLWCTGSSVLQAAGRAIDGHLDLAGWDPAVGRLISLDGQWQFVWNRLLEPADFPGVNTRLVPVPATWQEIFPRRNGQELHGCASYRLVVTNLAPRQEYGLLIPVIASSFRLFANGKPVAVAGVPAASRVAYTPQMQIGTASFWLEGNSLELVLQVASHDVYDGGIWQSFQLGSREAILNRRMANLGWDTFLTGSLFIMGLYHLALYLLRRQDAATLYFGMFCLLVSLRTFAVGQYFYNVVFPNGDWHLRTRIEFLAFYLAVPAILGYIRHLYPDEVPRWALLGTSTVAGLFGLPVLVAPISFYVLLLPWYQVAALCVVAYVVLVLVRSLLRRREGALILLLGCLAMVMAFVNDMLFASHILKTGYFFSLGLFVFIFSQSFLLSIRFSRAFRTAETLFRRMERLVEERTAELAAQRNTLQAQNELIEQELSLARRIQMEFVPSASPGPHVAFFYKTMARVGGDFIDFIQFRTGELGVFISDVSGHGVPAAFVTSMIKSFSAQARDLVTDPAAFLFQLNEFLLPLTAGNFVTALYGIFNSKERRFVYANAGHDAPLLVERGGQVRQFPGQGRALPLAVFGNGVLEAMDRVYRNEVLQLQPRSKLFLYTDGLTETVNERQLREDAGRELEQFGTRTLPAVLRESVSLPPKRLVTTIVERLVAFRGSQEFDDDVCMICIEVE